MTGGHFNGRSVHLIWKKAETGDNQALVSEQLGSYEKSGSPAEDPCVIRRAYMEAVGPADVGRNRKAEVNGSNGPGINKFHSYLNLGDWRGQPH